MTFYIPEPGSLRERICKMLALQGPKTLKQLRAAFPDYRSDNFRKALDFLVARCIFQTASGYELSDTLARHYANCLETPIYEGEIVPSTYTKPFQPLDIAKMPWLSRALNPGLRQDFNPITLASNVPVNALEW